MLFIRRGARNVFIRSAQIDRLADYFIDRFDGKIRSFEDGWTEVQEFHTLLFLTPPGLERTRVEDAEKIVVVPFEASRIFAELFKPAVHDLIETVHLGSGLIIIRVAGDGSGLEKELIEQYRASSMSLEAAIDEGEADDTILILTNTSLSMTITFSELIRTPLLVKQPSHLLYWELRRQGARLITQSLKDKQWYEMRINIYDAANHYNIHYERLQTVFSDLDIGMILGETWTRDHALVLMSVLAYQVRLFTLEPPENIKRVLMGLEYNRFGRRFVDMDLYYRNRKVNKNDKKVRRSRNESRKEIREDLFGRLTGKALDNLRILEAPIEEEE